MIDPVESSLRKIAGLAQLKACDVEQEHEIGEQEKMPRITCLVDYRQLGIESSQLCTGISCDLQFSVCHRIIGPEVYWQSREVALVSCCILDGRDQPGIA